MQSQASWNTPVVRWALVVVTLLLCISAGVNLLAIRRMRAARDAVAAISGGALRPGRSVPPIVAQSLAGKAEQLRYSDSKLPTVVYIFSPQCVWCERNLPNLRSVVRQRGGEYRFVGLSLSDGRLGAFAAMRRLGVAVMKDPAPATVAAYGLGGTPYTIVVAPSGRILQSWGGAWAGDLTAAVQSYFGLTLPGLAPVPLGAIP